MTDAVAEPNVAEMLRPFVISAFRKKAIRSVVLVDEEFDSLHELLSMKGDASGDANGEREVGEIQPIAESEIAETEHGEVTENLGMAETDARKALANAVAKRLYDEMNAAGLICDVINQRQQWTDVKKIANADLVILDWHLSGGNEDSSEAVGILRRLALHPRFNLVVAYTNHRDLHQAARHLCGCLRKRIEPDGEVESNFTGIEDLFDAMNPPITEMRDAFLLGHQQPRQFCREFKAACARKFHLRGDQLTQVVELLVEKQLKDELGCTLGDEEFVPLTGDFEASQPWLVYENLFVCFAKKTDQQLQLLNVLDQSLVAWNPGIPRTIVSEIRNAISRKRHEFDNDFPHDLETQAGWLWYAKKSGRAGTEGVRQLLKGVLRSFQDRVLSDNDLASFVESVLAVIPEKGTPSEQVEEAVKWCGFAGNSFVEPHSVVHALNVFHSSSAFCGEHVTTGTILKRIRGNHPEWLVVVEPACNLVPSQVRENARFISCRMLRLEQVPPEKAATVLDEAVRGQHLFVQVTQQRFYFSIGNPKASQQPIIIDSYVPRNSQISVVNGQPAVEVHFPNLREATPTSTNSSYQIVAQLHEPYANRLLHAIGAHLSRIGLDFVSFPKPQQDGEQPQ